jgi:hypothetical protein
MSYSNEHDKINWKGQLNKVCQSKQQAGPSTSRAGRLGPLAEGGPCHQSVVQVRSLKRRAAPPPEWGYGPQAEGKQLSML